MASKPREEVAGVPEEAADTPRNEKPCPKGMPSPAPLQTPQPATHDEVLLFDAKDAATASPEDRGRDAWHDHDGLVRRGGHYAEQHRSGSLPHALGPGNLRRSPRPAETARGSPSSARDGRSRGGEQPRGAAQPAEELEDELELGGTAPPLDEPTGARTAASVDGFVRSAPPGIGSGVDGFRKGAGWTTSPCSADDSVNEPAEVTEVTEVDAFIAEVDELERTGEISLSTDSGGFALGGPRAYCAGADRVDASDPAPTGASSTARPSGFLEGMARSKIDAPLAL